MEQDNITAQKAASPLKPHVAVNLALVLACLGLGVGGWQWLENSARLEKTQADVAKRLTEVDSVNKESRLLAGQAKDNLKNLQDQMTQLTERVNESQQAQASLQSLYQDLMRSQDELVLTEIEQLLLLANQQLQLAANVNGALAALQTADARLARLDKPQFVELRKALVSDIEKLKAVPQIDLVGMSLRLDGLVAEVDNLPLTVDIRPTKPTENKTSQQMPPPWWQRIGVEMWHDLKDIIRIQNTAQPDLPLLTPEQSANLRQQLKLRLLTARIALLQRDDTNFKADLSAAQSWLKRYFDLQAPAVKHAYDLLAQLQTNNLHLEIPAIAASLNAVQGHRHARERSKR